MKIANVLLWGGGCKARIISEMLGESNIGDIKIIFDETLEKLEFESGANFINDVEDLKRLIKNVTSFVVCIGAEHGYARFKTGKYLEKIGLNPLTIIHHKCFIEPTATLGVGCQIMPCAVIHKFSSIGNYSIVNTNATVDHECVIGDGVHIMGNVAVAGKVKIGNYATIGTNATILPFLNIGEGSYVGAGAVVTKNVPPYSVVVGNPAKFIKKNKLKFFEESLIQLTT